LTPAFKLPTANKKPAIAAGFFINIALSVP
jgi:hypothetical protein